MGFNIGVYSDQVENNFDCYEHIDRIFYTFVNTGETFGEKSVLIRSGQYFGLDLSPFVKLVYSSDEVSPEYADRNKQSPLFLLELTSQFKKSILVNPTFIDLVEYQAYHPLDKELEKHRHSYIKKLIRSLPREDRISIGYEKPKKRDKNPWAMYFHSMEIIDHLEILERRLKCYIAKGATEVYLTAG